MPKSWHWLLLITLTAELHSVVLGGAEPTGHYSLFCVQRYEDPRDPITLYKNIKFNLHKPLPLKTTWVWPWGKNYIARPSGVMAGCTVHDLEHDCAKCVWTALDNLAGVLQGDLQDRAGAKIDAHPTHNNPGSIFSGKFGWKQEVDEVDAIKWNICMPYSKVLVKDTPHIYKKSDSVYLHVRVGDDEDNNPIMEHAHRLVCATFNGGPRLADADPFNWRLHCNHLCLNKACLNPRHLKWVTARDNKRYQGQPNGLGWVSARDSDKDTESESESDM